MRRFGRCFLVHDHMARPVRVNLRKRAQRHVRPFGMVRLGRIKPCPRPPGGARPPGGVRPLGIACLPGRIRSGSPAFFAKQQPVRPPTDDPHDPIQDQAAHKQRYQPGFPVLQKPLPDSAPAAGHDAPEPVRDRAHPAQQKRIGNFAKAAQINTPFPRSRPSIRRAKQPRGGRSAAAGASASERAERREAVLPARAACSPRGNASPI